MGEFTVSEEWVAKAEATVMAMKYTNTDYESSCNKMSMIEWEEINYTAQCTDGIAGATLVLYLNNVVPEDCEACDVDSMEDTEEHYCAYSIEIPCEVMSVECGEPSAAPSGSFFPSSAPSAGPTASSAPSSSPSSTPSASPTDVPSSSPSASPSDVPSASPSGSPSGSPSASPSDSPTANPSNAPSAGPTSSPSGSPSGIPSVSPSSSPSSNPTAYPTESMAPTDCYMATPPKVQSSVCMSGKEELAVTAMPSGTVIIHGQHGDSVDFSIFQRSIEDPAGM